ncbi:MAG TPA: Xaa-Pro aminopeptidase [Deltaproteobacteria bacterium]|nr:Xaa-Pro aminopeptidase [Deltaproteobacteria bacterium]HCP45997.1 Xaa-Pro aminopeptidase [Deltaproteobacteria bacterium]
MAIELKGPAADVLRARRQRLSKMMSGEPILLVGHGSLPRNFLANTHPFRQDSTFLYFLGVDQPGAAAVIGAGGHTTLYMPSPAPGDELWHGPGVPFERWVARSGVDEVCDRSSLQPASYHCLPVADPVANQEASRLSGTPLDPRNATGSEDLRAAVVSLRLCRDAGEVQAIRRALCVTSEAHRVAMESTAPGVTDTEVHALIDAVFALHGMPPSYTSIVTARGEVLHGHARNEPLRAGEMLLVDAGAEDPSGYASDVTRTWPVSGTFTARQAEVYDAVLEANAQAIACVEPGRRYREVHLAALEVLTVALRDLGLLRGSLDGLLEQGAASVFFPHGVGHLLGLDVHDMELLGDAAGYPVDRHRDPAFGLSALRLDRDLQPGMVVTIEPGIYLVPGILEDATLRAQYGDSVDWAEAECWLPFGGVRIEDDVLVTADGNEVLSASIPRTRSAVEALVGTGPSPRQRLLGGSAS